MSKVRGANGAKLGKITKDEKVQLRDGKYTQVSNRKLQLFELLHESGILHFHKCPWGSQNPLSDKS